MVFTEHATTGAAKAAQSLTMTAAFGPLGAVLIHLELGLYIFFVLSAYLVGRPFVRAALDGRRLPSLTAYARHRTLRIVPALWIITTLVVLRYVLLPNVYPAGTFTASPLRIMAIYTFLQIYFPSALAGVMSPAWSLHPEVGFYLLVPLMALAIGRWHGSRRAREGMFILILVVTLVGGMYLRKTLSDSLQFRRSIPEMMYAFVPGLLLAGLEPRLASRLRGWRPGRWLALGVLATGAALFALTALLPNYPPLDPDVSWSRSLLQTTTAECIVAAPLVWQWSTEGGWWALSRGPMQWLGTRAYSFYLLHQPLGLELFAWVHPSNPRIAALLLFLVVLPLTIALSDISYRFIERPFLRLKGTPMTRLVGSQGDAERST